MASFILGFLVVMFSMLAGMFWVASGYGYTVDWQPWRIPKPVPRSKLAAHQAYWNARAALSAAVAAIAQAFLFVVEHYSHAFGF
jgi:hypothetical protein